MLLYHTGFQEIPRPELKRGRKNADFGQGFYLTENPEFARRWARRREGQDTVVNTYELETEGLRIHRFERDADWFAYIFGNRRNRPDLLDADAVTGPIANDTLFDTLGILTSGYLTDAEALRLMLVGPEYRQTALKTEKALIHLKWIGTEKLSPAETEEWGERIREEQDRYLRELAEEMERL